MNFHLFFVVNLEILKFTLDTEPELIEHMIAICRICNVTLRIIKREIPLCPTCNKPLTRNGTKTSDLNNEDSIKLQNI